MKARRSVDSGVRSTVAGARLAPLLLISLAVAAIAAEPIGRASSEPLCDPGWRLLASYDDSFNWQGLPSMSAAWEGSVQLWEEFDSNCALLQVLVYFTGPNSGGTVSMSGNDIGLLFSVQYPQPFEQLSDRTINAYGDALFWGPDGNFPTYYAHTHPDINERGAEEYWIGTLPPIWFQETPTGAVVTGVHAAFTLPLELVGQTVYAQIHVYPDLCQCSVTAIPIP